MRTITSPEKPETPKLDELQEFYLPRIYMHRSLLRRMAQRLEYVALLAGRAREADGAGVLYASLDVLYHTWLLIEQVRKVYEIVAAQVDVRFAGQRRSLDSRINNPRSPEQAATYHHRVWLFPPLDFVPDSAFTRLGLDPARSRELLSGIADRSAARLTTEEAELRAFYDRYEPVGSAYKHGRAIFGMAPTLIATGEREGTLNLSVSETTATILLSAEAGAPPHSFLTITPDDEFWLEVDRVLQILEAQVPRLLAFIEAFASTTEATMEQVRAGTNDAWPSFPFTPFADPYTAEEQALLDAWRRGTIRLYEG